MSTTTDLEQDLQRHKEAIYTILQVNGKSLIDLIKKCPEYADDYRAVMTASETYPDAIYLASGKLFANKTFAFNACVVQSVAFDKVPKSIKEDFDFIMSLLNASVAIYQSLPDKLQGNHLVAKLAIEKGVVTNQIMFTPLKNDVSLMKMIAKSNYGFLKELSENSDIRNNKTIGSIMLSRSMNAYKLLGKKLAYDADFLADEVHKSPELIDYIPLNDEHFETVIPMILAFIDAKDTFQADFIRYSVDQTNPEILIAVAKALKDKPQSYFLNAIAGEDKRLIKLNTQGNNSVVPWKDFCLEQFLTNLSKENLLTTVESTHLKQFMLEELQKRELLDIDLSPKNTKLKQRKIRLP